MKLGLGTVQFGMPYGISNPAGMVSEQEVVRILCAALELGLEVIDTAPAYELSEKVLGEALPKNHSLHIVTKTPAFKTPHISEKDCDHLNRTFHVSLERLRQNSLYGLIVHHVDDLFAKNGDKLFAEMQKLKAEGLVKKIGISVYSPEQVDLVLKRYDVDLVQLPLNVLDQRFVSSGCLKKLKALHVEVHARSAFLQGLLLMELQQLRPHFDSVSTILQEYQSFVADKKISVVEAALSFVNSQVEVDHTIVGVCSVAQLNEIHQGFKNIMGKKFDFEKFSCTDEKIVNPSKWVI